jgi:hypothetical protein
MTRAAAFALVLSAACSNTTGGDLITLPFVAGGVARDATQPFTFTTPVGWTVTLNDALIALGPFYFNVNAPRTGTFRSGVVIVEATEQVVVNALDPTLAAVAGGADGETGTAVAVEIGLLPPDPTNGSAADALGAGFGFVDGTATMGATTVAFTGQIAVNQSLVTATEPLADLERIKGAAVDIEFPAAPRTLVLRVDPTHWFDQSQFDEIPSGTWTVDSTFAAQLLQGVESEAGVYAFSLSTGSSP